MMRIENKFEKSNLSTTHDINNRSLAICYIDGNILTGKTHNEIITEYLEWQKTDIIRRPKSDEYTQDIYEIAFGHIVEEEKTIYIEEDSMENVYDDIVSQIIKLKYPDYNIIYENMY